MTELALHNHLVVMDSVGVGSLLLKEPELVDLVNEAAAQLLSFIPDAHMRLELLIDPDYGEGEQLFLGVSTSLEDKKALAALRRFDQEWWVHNDCRSRGLLCIDLSGE